jgi:hypothetical protein
MYHDKIGDAGRRPPVSVLYSPREERPWTSVLRRIFALLVWSVRSTDRRRRTYEDFRVLSPSLRSRSSSLLVARSSSFHNNQSLGGVDFQHYYLNTKHHWQRSALDNRQLLFFRFPTTTACKMAHEERFIPDRQKLDQLGVVKDYAAVPRLEYRYVHTYE